MYQHLESILAKYKVYGKSVFFIFYILDCSEAERESNRNGVEGGMREERE